MSFDLRRLIRPEVAALRAYHVEAPPGDRPWVKLDANESPFALGSAMREELARVLAYKQIVPRLAYYQRSAAHVLADFDRLVRLVDVAPKAHPTCKDPDDQKFIDLAVAWRALLLSKDHAVISMEKRLLALGVHVQAAT